MHRIWGETGNEKVERERGMFGYKFYPILQTLILGDYVGLGYSYNQTSW